MLEQVDLFLTTLDIGVCWYGVAKPEAMAHDGLKYAVMLAFGKCQSKDFRVDLSEFKRKPVKDIWKGNAFQAIGNELRIPPSGCNLQPWRMISEEKTIRVFRQFNMRSFPAKKREFYSETDFSLIDMGICLCYLELSLEYHGYSYNRKLHPDDIPHEELTQIATYHIE